MPAYYNEIDPYAAQWLRNLIDAGLIAPGEVDTRSIVDVRPADLAGFEQCHFFAGLGGWGGALRLAGVPDDRPLWTGSCPCQPFSAAGQQKGFADERHLWPHFRDLIRERRPAIVLGEQVAAAAQWLRLVRGDLEAMDYAVGCIPIEAASAGADHLRDRYWFVAHSEHGRCEGRREERSRTNPALSSGQAGLANAEGKRGGEVLRHVQGETGVRASAGHAPQGREDDVADADECGRQARDGAATAARHGHSIAADGDGFEWVTGFDGKARRVKSGVRLLAHGVPARVAKLRALGNAIDLRPAVAFIRAAL